MTNGPLAGIKVVEIAGLGPAPCCGMLLADMGAEVILVERKVPNSNAAAIGVDESDKVIFNRGKRSIAVNLKSEEGVELVLKLISSADVLIEGFRPGVMERLGLGPDISLERNPKLIYGRMTGWGQTGPMSRVAGHDPNYISLSGALWYAGRRERPPTAPLTLIGDMGGGAMVLAWGILCGLLNVQSTGNGQVIDAAITDGSAYLSTLLWFFHGGGELGDKPENSWVNGAAPWNDTYTCADGKYITVCALEPKFYQELIERLELRDNPIFSEQWDKSQWSEGKRELKQLFLSEAREKWCELLEGTDTCFAPVLNFSEAPRHPHNVARNTFIEINGVVQASPAPKFSRSTPCAGVPPKLGEHTDEILQMLDFNQELINKLKESGVV